MRSPVRRILFLLLVLLTPALARAAAPDGQAIVAAAVEYYREKASTARVRMTIHRPAWERAMTIRVWTKGRENSLMVLTAPPKDQGNATLKKATEMWTFNPKVNRVIKLPPALMSQSWMGSDFTNHDLARSDSILEDYDHILQATERDGDLTVHVIRSVPRPAAPVIWGSQRLFIREDHLLIRQEFYDEQERLVKALTGRQVETLGGKPFPRFWRMEKPEEPGEFTELEYLELEFLDDLPDRLFTLEALRNPGGR